MLIRSLEIPKLGFYIHTPWCVRKCPYCDFNSSVKPNNNTAFTAYVNALIQDIFNIKIFGAKNYLIEP